MAITDPRLIAASSDGSAGSNGNLEQLIALQNQQLPSGANPMDMYSNLVLQVGNLGANAKANVTAEQPERAATDRPAFFGFRRLARRGDYQHDPLSTSL